MRVRKISAVALVSVAAGLALTACAGTGSTGSGSAAAGAPSAGASAGTPTASPTSAGSSSGGQAATDPSASATAAAGAPVAATAPAVCRTAQLSFSASGGMAEGEVLINLTNTGSASCTMHGFPGVDLKGADGTISAARSSVAVPTVVLRPGQATRFTLHYPPNNTGGSGVTFHSLVVTPPNETHSHTMSLSINIPVGSKPGSAVTVDPVGAGK
ncbi:uncharacterized protein DUF4232 [Streptomyces sp. 846.5]|nr:DUF4232 domain-containing protein [Streptomyces sp. 846.5]TDU03271.1 uncharacterized protein DUF4232 [Streptomyces sp. 846.5]